MFTVNSVEFMLCISHHHTIQPIHNHNTIIKINKIKLTPRVLLFIHQLIYKYRFIALNDPNDSPCLGFFFILGCLRR